MSDYDSLDDNAFRLMVREWIAANYPQRIRNPPRRLGREETREWYLLLSRQGWLCPGWPREYGGMGLSAGKQLIMMEEMEEYGCARLPDSGVTMLGPLLIRYGDEAQRARFLPRILSGEDIWCQGYSEPNAGSDLASLRTEARLENGEWVINGQKTWTTMGSEANWIFLLVRTERSAKAQHGISFLLVPMDSPGIEVRPILNLELHGEFCEVFFNDVRVPSTAWSAESTRVGAWPRRCSVSSGSSSVRPSSPPSLSSAWSAWPGTWDCGTTLCSCAASPR